MPDKIPRIDRPILVTGATGNVGREVVPALLRSGLRPRAALSRPIRYQPASILGYVRHLRRRGAPKVQIAVQTFLHLGLRLGHAERVDPTLQALLGRPGRTLADYVRDHLALFSPQAARASA